jgi:hypothetical protein
MPADPQTVQDQIIAILSIGDLTGATPAKLNQAIASANDDLTNDLLLTGLQLQILYDKIQALVAKYSDSVAVSQQDFNKCKTVRDLIALVVLRAAGSPAAFTPPSSQGGGHE